jgi:hypothetical protein
VSGNSSDQLLRVFLQDERDVGFWHPFFRLTSCRMNKRTTSSMRPSVLLSCDYFFKRKISSIFFERFADQ